SIQIEPNGRNQIDTVTITAEPGETIDEVTLVWANGSNEGVGFDAFTATPAPTGAPAIAEDAAAGTVIANVSPSDPDAGESFQFRLADDAGGRLAIDASGVIRVADGAEFDHETESEITAVVEVEDSAGNTRTAEIVVAVNDVNEGPGAVGFTGGSVAENAPAGTLAGTASSSDVDAGDTVAYSLADDAGGLFAIDASTGEITTTAELDHESADGYTLRVVATDSGGLTSEADVAVTVTDVNDGPSVEAAGPISAGEGEAVTLRVNASDQDGDALSYSWTQVDGPAVTLDDANAAEPGFVAPDVGTDTTMTFEVTVSDGESETIELVTVEVAANATPTLETDNFVTVREGESVALEASARPAALVSFDETPVESYGGSGQDISVDVAVESDTLRMEGNGWKSVDFPYEVTPDTVLEFQFRSTAEGELHGIGFDNDNGISPETTFKIMGTQNWGDRSYDG
ncbi:MAG: cadherin domain-containing protein, partial [Planctomycetota bacterium]